uniref:C2H2-type domain-containing protein n=1 Tax=Strigamia maritima TaxID=126957 RepID=T1IPS7_STRMM
MELSTLSLKKLSNANYYKLNTIFITLRIVELITLISEDRRLLLGSRRAGVKPWRLAINTRKYPPRKMIASQTIGIKAMDSRYSRMIMSSDKDESNRKIKKAKSNHMTSTTMNNEIRNDHRLHDPSPVALLDMLAEVASATLKNDLVLTPSVPFPVNKVKSTSPVSSSVRRTPYNSDLLNLDQIRMLSDRLLLNMFSDQTADELRKTYTFTCFLMPEKCQQTYSSFGNEHKARLLMKTHLLAHIAELVVEDNKPDRSPDRKFIAETLNARKKRLAGSRRRVLRKNTRAMRAKRLMAQTKEKTVKTGPNNSKTIVAEPGKFLRLSTLTSNDEIMDEKFEENGEDNSNDNFEKESVKSNKKKPSRLNGAVKTQQAKQGNKTKAIVVQDVENNKNKNKLSGQKQPRARKRKRTCETSEASTETKFPNDDEFGQTSQKSESWIFRDHNYTHIDGKKKDFDKYDRNASDEDDVETDSYRCPVIEEGSVNINSLMYSVLLECDVEHTNGSIGPVVAEFEEIKTTEIEKKDNKKGPELLEGVALQTKPKRIRRINKIIVPEEYATESSQSSEEEDESDEIEKPVQSTTKVVEPNAKAVEPLKVQAPKEGTPEWERKLALKCIRMLRTRRKDERITLVCKICQDKIFTAQATLMYHYRSHAGIKPFVCNICNTTFTRQHSLNYHMLIHNNKSRFTCVECGRKFRHPSHFKEHMRRHTGETPFECGDCGLRFKTRNTYKRHLKTRHGKLLTATGIVVLTSEEFLLVKTNPRKKASQRKDKETQWPDAECSTAGTLPSSTPQRSDKVTVKYCNELKLTSAMVQKHLKKNARLINVLAMEYVQILSGSNNDVMSLNLKFI